MAANSPKTDPSREKESKPAASASKSGRSGSSAGKSPAPKSAAKQSRKASEPKKAKSASGTSGASDRSRDPLRNRRLKALFCLMLALFSLIGCFTMEGFFIRFFRRFMQGLVGKGFFFLPPALLFCAVMLEYVRDQPLSGRVVCTLSVPVTMGSLIHLFGCIRPFSWSWKLPVELYQSGILAGEDGSGGAISGLIAVLFESLFNRVGAAIVLILLTLFLLLTAGNVTVAALVDQGRERSRRKAEEWRVRREEERVLTEERRRAAEESVRERRERAETAQRQSADEAPGIDPLPRHPVTAGAKRESRRGELFDFSFDSDPLPASESAPGKKPAVRKPAQPAAPTAPEKSVKSDDLPRRDWLSEILAKDRERSNAKKKADTAAQRSASGEKADEAAVKRAPRTSDGGSASGRIIHTAIVPKSAEPVPEPRLESARSEELPLRPLPEPDAEAKAEAPSRPEAPEEKAAGARPSVRPVSTAIRPKSRVSEDEEELAITPQIPPAAKGSAPVRPAVTPEAAAVLADEKTARAVEKAETVKAKAEMVASIEENLAGEVGAKPVPYQFPPLELLTAGTADDSEEGLEEITVNARRLSAAIKSFGIPAEICDVVRGPTVTRYEVELEQGVKLNRLTNLADDIALALGASGVRIAPVPDKISIVGIEVPNKTTTTIYLRDILDTPAFREKSGALPFAVGMDIGGAAIVGDISRLPHLMIAGTTGSGKSVCMNSLILSLLYKCSPEDVRLIMIDPKMVELGIYNGIPHLLIPVVTDPKKAAGALQWADMEMQKRNALLAESGARDITGYNRLMEREGGQKLPRMVILIDELANLMAAAAKDVEDSICNIAAVGRAAGIHLVVATQRPSADVITGLMKANISTRIAFAVDSALNSRIILDTSGAEKLVGKGDMLYSPIGIGKPVRIQGTFVTDEEREAVISYVKQQSGTPVYDRGLQDELERSTEKEPESSEVSDLDELFDEAVDVVLGSNQASVSMLQRRLKLGYGRAARIVDQMEEQGVIGPYEGSKPRQVLLTRQQWNAMRGIESVPGAEDEPVSQESLSDGSDDDYEADDELMPDDDYEVDGDYDPDELL